MNRHWGASPILVDFLPRRSMALPGRLGLTIAPGKWRLGADGPSDRLLEDDLERIRDHYGAAVLVTLLEELEMRFTLGIPDLLAGAARAGLETIWFPIADVSVPASVEDTVALVDVLVGRLRAGRTVVVHCRGGLGRSGMVAACCLAAVGSPPAQAIATVREARSGAIQTSEQERFVTAFADAWRG